jgi:starch phosphorylase
MKVAMNGGLNCSILDGWWVEGYNGENGWAVGPEEETPDPQTADIQDSQAFYEILEKQVAPLYYEQKNGIPKRWVDRMKNAIKTLTPAFCSDRQVSEYARQIYAIPAPLTLGRLGGESQSAKQTRITRR